MERQRICTSRHIWLEVLYGLYGLETYGTCPKEGITTVNPDN